MRSRRSMAGLLALLAFLGVVVVAATLGRLLAYDYYSNYGEPDGLGNCASCHEPGPGGFVGRGPLHGAHTTFATSTCQLCHTQQGDVPRLNSSGVTGGLGCIGCHGQPLPAGSHSGAGLRLHHTRANAPADQNGLKCVNCHANDPVPPPESAIPAYYARTDVIQKTPCNTDGKEDFWNRTTGLPDGRGLDNDGDLLHDAAEDPDCGASACIDLDQDGYGNPGDPSCLNGSTRDCDDARADVYPGATEAYDQQDNNCNGEVDEVERLGFNDPTLRRLLTWSAQPPAGQLYDVVRSGSPQFLATNPYSTCLIVGTPLTYLDDSAPVPASSVFCYLVRNTLVGDYGKTSSGVLRQHALCP